MGISTQIEWTSATWNPWRGCKKISPGCNNCYMFRNQRRYGRNPSIIEKSKTTFSAPMKWKNPLMIFTCSWSDWFIEEADEWRIGAWDIIKNTPRHLYQILTKRPERIIENLPKDWGTGWENVWLGVTVETNDYSSRIDVLKQIPAYIRFVSFEPLLEEITLFNLSGIDWVITGGESGPDSRPCNLYWVKNIIQECNNNNIPVFHKQNGGNKRINGSWGGHSIDGIQYREFPRITH